jgi:hypothetical protein
VGGKKEEEGVKVLHLIYDLEFEPLVTAILHRDMVIPRYTRLEGVTGARAIQAALRGDYALAQKNRMLIVIAPEAQIAKLVAELKQLRVRLKHGLRGYVTPAEQVI